MKKVAIAIAIACLLVSVPPTHALEKKPIKDIDSDQLTGDTQVTASAGDEHFNFVWWIPNEFWQATFANDKSTPEAEKKKFIEALKPYSLVGICQADISNFGAFKFYSQQEIEKSLAIIFKSPTGQSYELAPVKDIDPDVDVLLKMFKPILSSAMGNMGQNFHFFVVEDYDQAGKRKVDPYEFSTLEFHLKSRTGGGIKAQLEFPLNSLYVPRQCPNGKDAHVTWKFCPWSGKPLAE